MIFHRLILNVPSPYRGLNSQAAAGGRAAPGRGCWSWGAGHGMSELLLERHSTIEGAIYNVVTISTLVWCPPHFTLIAVYQTTKCVNQTTL